MVYAATLPDVEGAPTMGVTPGGPACELVGCKVCVTSALLGVVNRPSKPW